jgi:hypothetical protein
MFRSRRRGLAATVALVVLSLTVTSLASAASESKQDKAIAKNKASIKKVVNGIAAVRKSLASLTTTTTHVDARVTGVDTRLTGVDTRLKGIEAATAPIVSGLEAVKDDLTTQTARLQTLDSAYQAVEFGRAALSPGDADLFIYGGGAGTSADIPDDGNAISLDDTAIIVAGAGATTETLDLRALIRSAESDGDDAEKPAGQAGGFLQVTNADTGARVPCIGAPNPPGILRTPTGESIVTPNGTVTDRPLMNIPGGHSRTDTTEPTGVNGKSLLPVACAFDPTPGTTYSVHWSVQFLDIPTSATPGPDE